MDHNDSYFDFHDGRWISTHAACLTPEFAVPCKVCGALVSAKYGDRHVEWHKHIEGLRAQVKNANCK
jgi:hypothetical protein